MPLKPISVSQLNTYVNRILSTDPILMNVSVCGEVTNLTKHSGGHWYFSIKDANSTLKCFLAFSRVSKLRYEISEGMQIIAYGNISVYEKGGYYSLNVKDIECEGEGALQQAFNNLKIKLENEGLFAASHKRPIPIFPRKIGVVTSPTGAAIRDIITTVRRRNPLVDILLYPCLVQGDGSAETVIKGIQELNKFDDIDVLIVGRGGGSAEDLWTFNEESVARAIYNSRIPVISAVGHEVDILISDYVADRRAATPTAAAELAVPHIDNYIDRIERCNPVRMYQYLLGKLDVAQMKIDHLKQLCLSANPLNVLQRGYAAVKTSNGKVITSVNDIKPGDKVSVLLSDGSFDADITEVENA